MNISDELLARYFKGKCTPEEKLSVVNYLERVNDLPEHLLSKNEWDDAEDAFISEEKSERIFAVVKDKTILKPKRIKSYSIISIAAALLAICTVGFLMMNKTKPALKLAETKIKETKIVAPIVWKSFVNYTDNSQTLTLPDGSAVNVYPGGEIRYAIPFIKDSREVYLTGKSFFQVAKDKKHPFVVYSKGISTTALGTSFTITAAENSKLIKVELHTGKVWVKNSAIDRSVLPFNKILIPGDELVYNAIKKQVKVMEKTLLANETPKRNELNFKQIPLKNVLNKLQEHYKIKIIYNEADLDEISFTGTINLNQKAERILKEITELNKLNQTKTTEGYIISK